MNSELIELLGRTGTVKDVEGVYRRIYESKRQHAVRARQAKNSRERQLAEIELFLDDLKQITGLPYNMHLLSIACAIIGKRLQERELADEYQSALAEGWDF